ncbi:MAG TPA: hypothetical protein VGI39_05140 [Polyangiaceae bacterium]
MTEPAETTGESAAELRVMPEATPSACGWDALKVVTHDCPNAWQSYAVTTSCVSGTSALTKAEIWFMQHGCSAPVTWWGWAGSENADAVIQLCEFSNDIDDYAWYGVNGGKILPNADVGPHTSWGFCDATVPHPPPGYYWVVPFECPQCPGGGCMIHAP